MTNITNNLYNLSILKEIDGDEYVLQVVEIFLEEAPLEIEAIQKAYMAKDIPKLCKTAHRLKGSAMVMQADRFSELLNCIEVTAKAGETGKVIELLLQDMKQLYMLIERALQNEAILLGR